MNRFLDDDKLRQKIESQQIADERSQDEIRSFLGISEKGKRFKLNREEFAKERYSALKKALAEIRKENPEVLSFCMYGSMAKGEAGPSSDIDGYIFVDVEKLQGDPGKKVVETGLNVGERPDAPKSKKAYAKLTRDLEHFYLCKFKRELRKSAVLGDKQLQDIRVLPISRDIIDMQVDELKRSFENPEKSMRRTPSWLDENKTVEVEEAVVTHVGDNLSRMFHLDVGGGIRGYRAYLLKKLSGMGETGERIWHQIIVTTATMEHFSLSAAKYPQTLEEAQSIYGKRKE